MPGVVLATWSAVPGAIGVQGGGIDIRGNRMAESFDLVVIGSGAGGSNPLSACREAGWRVAIVDDEPFGGTCELRGCDPKKVLVGAAEVVDWQRRMTGSGVGGDSHVDWPGLMRFKGTFTDPAPARHRAAYDKAGIIAYRGSARFRREDSITIATDDGHEVEIHSKHFVVASGAEPAPLGIPGEEHVCTSTDFLSLGEIPRRIAFIGAGYISFEFAHVSRRAGAQVTVLGRATPLGHFDQDLVSRLVAHTRSLGIDLRTDTEVVSVERMDGAYRVHVKSDSGEKSVDADLVVHGAGRVPRTGKLDLASARVDTDSHGAVVVNDFLQSSSNPRVYAAGDCKFRKGSLPLTPVASHEGVIVSSNLLNGNSKRPDYRGIPSVVFTVPPLASVGLTEKAARSEGLHVTVKCAESTSWFSNRRIQEPVAMFKTIVENGTDRVVGAHLIGPDAPNVINIFALAVKHGLSATDLRHMIYAYPTSASDVVHML